MYAEGAKGTKEFHKGFVRIPVFFATDRRLDLTSTHLTYLDERDEEKMSFGVDYAVVPVAEDKIEDLEHPELGWYKMLGNSDVGGPSSLLIPEQFKKFKTTTMSEDELLTNVKELVDASPKHELIVFVHGCCVGHDDSIKRAANLALWFDAPVLLYDWCAKPPIQFYGQNDALADQANDNFYKFMDQLISTKGVPAESIVLAGHSMGGRLVDNYLQRVSNVPTGTPINQFNDILWIQCDVDATGYSHHQTKLSSAWKRCHITISNKDDALIGSSIWRSPRLGRPNNLESELLKCKQQILIDTSAFKFGPTGHDMPIWLISKLHNESDKLPENEHFSTTGSGNLIKLKVK